MVKDARTQTRADSLLPLNLPRLIQVVEKPRGWPSAVLLGFTLKTTSVEDRWRLDDEWWREQPISRIYYRCILEDGQRVTIFQDLITNRWYHQNI